MTSKVYHHPTFSYAGLLFTFALRLTKLVFSRVLGQVPYRTYQVQQAMIHVNTLPNEQNCCPSRYEILNKINCYKLVYMHKVTIGVASAFACAQGCAKVLSVGQVWSRPHAKGTAHGNTWNIQHYWCTTTCDCFFCYNLFGSLLIWPKRTKKKIP